MYNLDGLAKLVGHYEAMQRGEVLGKADMADFFRWVGGPVEQIAAGAFINRCGTALCIAGTAIALLAPDTELKAISSQRSGLYAICPGGDRPVQLAASLLGITTLGDAQQLFHAYQWSMPWQQAHDLDPLDTMLTICRLLATGEYGVWDVFQLSPERAKELT